MMFVMLKFFIKIYGAYKQFEFLFFLRSDVHRVRKQISKFAWYALFNYHQSFLTRDVRLLQNLWFFFSFLSEESVRKQYTRWKYKYPPILTKSLNTIVNSWIVKQAEDMFYTRRPKQTKEYASVRRWGYAMKYHAAHGTTCEAGEKVLTFRNLSLGLQNRQAERRRKKYEDKMHLLTRFFRLSYVLFIRRLSCFELCKLKLLLELISLYCVNSLARLRMSFYRTRKTSCPSYLHNWTGFKNWGLTI